MSVLSDFYLSANRLMPLRWVSGNTYAVDADVWSPATGGLYRRIVAGAGATDPSADATNWKPVVTGGVKVQRGVRALASGTASGTVSITAVSSTSKCQLRIVSVKANTGAGTVDFSSQVSVEFTSTSLLTFSRYVSTHDVDIAWEVTEFLG